MTGTRLKSENICYFSKKYFRKIKILLKTNLGKMLIFFLTILTFLKAALEGQYNFIPTKYIYFFSISVRSKVFVKKLPKLNIQSVIAMD